jgi:hypothetical protein
VAFYSDKHGVFRVNRKDAAGGDGMTQFGRALHALNIDIICANSSQAKGRVERAKGEPPAGQDPKRVSAAPSPHSNAPIKPESQSILSKIIALMQQVVTR